MDRIDEYRQIANEFLEDFAKNDPNAQLIFDRSHESPRRGFANDLGSC
jgi:hypothetical protein